MAQKHTLSPAAAAVSAYHCLTHHMGETTGGDGDRRVEERGADGKVHLRHQLLAACLEKSLQIYIQKLCNPKGVPPYPA